MAELFLILKDAALLMIISVTLEKIRKGGEANWHMLIFIGILCLL